MPPSWPPADPISRTRSTMCSRSLVSSAACSTHTPWTSPTTCSSRPRARFPIRYLPPNSTPPTSCRACSTQRSHRRSPQRFVRLPVRVTSPMSDKLDLLFRAPRVITAAGEVARCIGVRDGRIAVIEPIGAEPDAEEVVKLGDDEVLIPGLVDTHVHVNEPGRTEWEGFASATRAAAAGGVTTIVDMPLNSIPPTVDVAALHIKRAVAAEKAYVDVGFWGGAVPGNVPDLRGLHDAGVFGFKWFLLHSGVDEFPALSTEQLEQAAAELAAFGAMMIVHAEDAHAIDRAASPRGDNYVNFLSSRPR